MRCFRPAAPKARSLCPRKKTAGTSPILANKTRPHVGVRNGSLHTGKERELAAGEGDLLAEMSAAAYATRMSSNYSSRPRAAEVMVDGTKIHPIRERERPEALFALEHLLR